MDQTPPPPPPSTTTTTTTTQQPPTDPQPPTPIRPPLPTPQSQQQQRPPPPTTTTSFNTRPWNHPQQQQPSHFTLPSSPSPRIALGIPTTPPASFSSLAPPSYQPIQPIGTILRPNNNNTQSSAPFQGHGMIRVTTSTPLNNNNNNNSNNQPWLSNSPSTQGKPPLPSPSSTLRPQTFQQQQQRPVVQQTHVAAQFTPPRSITQQQQQQMSRPMPMPMPAAGAAMGSQMNTNKVVVVEMEEVCNRIMTKRSVQEILKQIDPTEKFDQGVEDVLVDIAEEFVESITRFGCSLAKHRKSSVLEAKDVLLHLEKNWNMSLPGFGGDEIKTYKKPVVSDVHRERILAIRKSSAVSDSGGGGKGLGGQSGGNAKSHIAKGAAAVMEAA